MASPYVSSIVTKYGDVTKIKADVKTIHEILDRQGSDLIIGALAEYIGTSANRFKLSGSDRAMTMVALVDALEEALKERL